VTDELFNFRDLATAMAGQKTAALRPGVLFRTGNISHISVDQALTLRRHLKIGTYVDFRHEREINEFGKPEALLTAGVNWRNIPIKTDDPIFDTVMRPEIAHWVGLYHRMFERNLARWVEFLHVILEVDHALVYGCLFGKDRTGVATSFLLTTLDLHDEHIQSDYAATTENMLPRFYERFMVFWQGSPLKRSEIFQHFMIAHPEIIGQFCDIIRRDDDELDKLLRSAGWNEDLQKRLKEKLLVN
jgi:protein-tyrosine phosphatase